MTITIRHQPRGIALIMALVAITVLTILAAGFAISMKVETKLAQNADSEAQLYWAGIGGVQRACWFLAQENCPAHMLNQKWAGGTGGSCDTNGPLAGSSLNNYPVGDGIIKKCDIIDLERFANINTANAMQIQQALTLMGVDANDISVVSDSILDWIDTDDLPRVAGAESDYYQGLAVPYYAKNAPIDDLSELLLVKGVTREMYYGPNSPNHAPGMFYHKLGFGAAPGQTPDYLFGLTNVFTPYSNGKININTASTNVLQMIPGVDANMALAIVTRRASSDNVDDMELFQNIGQLAAIGLPQAASQIGQWATTRSSTFEVHVTAQCGSAPPREFVAVLALVSPTDVRVMGFYWK